MQAMAAPWPCPGKEEGQGQQRRASHFAPAYQRTQPFGQMHRPGAMFGKLGERRKGFMIADKANKRGKQQGGEVRCNSHRQWLGSRRFSRFFRHHFPSLQTESA
jgi:hypothetical protein